MTNTEAAAVLDGLSRKLLTFSADQQQDPAVRRVNLLRMSLSDRIQDALSLHIVTGGEDEPPNEIVCLLRMPDGTWKANSTPRSKRIAPFVCCVENCAGELQRQGETVETVRSEDLQEVMEDATRTALCSFAVFQGRGCMTNPDLLTLALDIHGEGIGYYLGTRSLTRLSQAIIADPVAGPQKLSVGLMPDARRTGLQPHTPAFGADVHTSIVGLAGKTYFKDLQTDPCGTAAHRLWPKSVDSLSPAEAEVGTLGGRIDHMIRDVIAAAEADL